MRKMQGKGKGSGALRPLSVSLSLSHRINLISFSPVLGTAPNPEEWLMEGGVTVAPTTGALFCSLMVICLRWKIESLSIPIDFWRRKCFLPQPTLHYYFGYHFAWSCTLLYIKLKKKFKKYQTLVHAQK